MSIGRIIGIRHRVKATAEGEARPTQVCIMNGDASVTYELENEQAELDFLMGQFPISYTPVNHVLQIGASRHLKMRKLRKDESTENKAITVRDSEQYVITHMADTFDGLCAGDCVAMVLGGSGDYFAFALARRGEAIGATVHRMPPSKLKEYRGEALRDDDAMLLAQLFAKLHNTDEFYLVRARDRETIAVREAHRMRIDTMKSRIACEQRLRQRFIGSIFVRPDGHFPEGSIEKEYDALKANDAIYIAVLKEETRRDAELKKLVEATGIWQKVIGSVEGLGWGIAARIVSAVVDVRRFAQSVTTPSDDHPLIAESRERQGHLEDIIRHTLTLSSLDMSRADIYNVFVELGKRDDLDDVSRQAVADILAEYRVRKDVRGKLRKVTRGDSKLSAFAGVHVLAGGKFARRRSGQLSNWNPDMRQALYLLGEQFNRRPDSYWGKKLRANKVRLRVIHPEPVVVDGKKKYSDGHIHKMATWRTLTKFVVWLYREWSSYEKDPAKYLYNPHVGLPLEEVHAAA